MSSVLHPGDGERRQTPTAKRSKPGGSLRHGWTHSTAREWNRESGTGVQASTGVAVPHPKISAPNLSWLSQPPFLHRVPKDAQRPACHFRISIPASCLCLQPASKHNIISRPTTTTFSDSRLHTSQWMSQKSRQTRSALSRRRRTSCRGCVATKESRCRIQIQDADRPAALPSTPRPVDSLRPLPLGRHRCLPVPLLPPRLLCPGLVHWSVGPETIHLSPTETSC